MKKLFLLAFVVLFGTSAAIAQNSYATVTATVSDPSGNPLAGAMLTATLVNSAGQQIQMPVKLSDGTLYNGSPTRAFLDPVGHFSVSIPTNPSVSSPANSQWSFVITAPTGPSIVVYPAAWNITYATSISGGTDLSAAMSAQLTGPVSFVNPQTGQAAFLSLTTAAESILPSTVANLPAATTANRYFRRTVSDGISATDCTVGGGTTAVPCWNPTGSGWSVFGGSGTGNAITALTGDGSAAGPGSAAFTLAASGVSAGSYINANVTFDAKGRATSASNGSAGGVPTATAANQLPLYKTSGSATLTPTTLGPDVTSTAQIDANGSRSFSFGYDCYGDSISASVGALNTNWGYCWQLNREDNLGAFYHTGAAGGSRAADMANFVYQKENPGDSGNPVVTLMIATNDVPKSTPQSYINQAEGGVAAWTALSSTNKILAVSTGQVQNVLIHAAGASWAKNDTATLTCATTNAVLTVNSVTTTGAVNTFTITNAGVGCSTAIGATVTASASGTGFTLDVIASPIQTQTGSWANDTTFTAVTGLQTSAVSTITDATCYVGPNGVAYFWYGQFGNAANTATYSVSINGVTLTDDYTSSSTLSAQSPPSTTYGPANLTTTFETIVAARFHGLTPGANANCVITANGSGGNPASVFAWGFPPATRYHGMTAPGIFLGGVPPQQNNASSAAVLTYNGYNRAIADQLSSDGLMVKFVDVQAALDPVVDFASPGVDKCFAAGSPGLHPNSGPVDGACGHGHLYLAFDDAIKGGSNYTQPQALTVAPASTFYNMNPVGTTPSASVWAPGILWGKYGVGDPFTTFMNMAATTTFGLPVQGGTFGLIDGALSAASNTTIHSYCSWANATFGTGAGLLPSNLNCPVHINGSGIWLNPVTLVESGTNSYPSSTIAIESEVSNGATWGRDISLFYSAPAVAGANPEMDNILAGGNQTTNNRCFWYQNGGATSGAHGIKLCAANAVGAFDAVISNSAITATRTFTLPDSTGTLGLGVTLPAGTATFTAGTNVTSCGCASTFTCTNTRGRLTIVGGTATTGTICTANFSAALGAAPWATVNEMGATALHGLDHGLPTTTAFTITAASTVTGATMTVDYSVLP